MMIPIARGLARSRPLLRTVVILAIVVLAALGASSSLATTLHHFDLPELVGRSTDIVHGRVRAVTCHWDSRHTTIVSEISLDVLDAVKGRARGHMTLRQLGGQVGDVRVDVDGCPSFHVGEEGVYFAARDRDGNLQMTGLAQGKFEVERSGDPRAKSATVQRATEGFAVADLASLSPLGASTTVPRFQLDGFLAQVRALVARGGGR